MFYGKLSHRRCTGGIVGILISSILLTGCFDSRTPASSVPTTEPQAVVKIAGQTIYLEVAQTPQQQATGLMHRTELASNQGMLFPFNPPQTVGFWMKNVPIPLDIIFLHHNKVVKIAGNLPPCTGDPCAVYPSGGPIDQVIELRGGLAAQLGLELGDSLSVKPLAPDSNSKF